MDSTIISSLINFHSTGTCLVLEGVLEIPSSEGKHVVQLKAEKILHIGKVDQDKYILSKKRLPLESLRDSAHFRPRTTTVYINDFLSNLNSNSMSVVVLLYHRIDWFLFDGV